MKEPFYRNKKVLLFFSFALYLFGFLFLLLDTDVFSNSPFFKVIITTNSTINNPEILGVVLTSYTQFVVFCVFFFINAFLGIYNHALISTLFSYLVNDSDRSVHQELKKNWPDSLFLTYSVWTSMRLFFNILGILSNVIFFVCTVSGSLVGNVITRRYILGLDDIQSLKESMGANSKSNREGELRPFLK